MIKRLLSVDPVYPEQTMAVLRIVTGALLIYHGKEVFDGNLMAEYQKWEQFGGNTWMPYLGKGAEFVAGILLVAGLLTRVASLITIGTFGYITFFIGGGRFWYQDQHPFMFLLLGLLFLMSGAGIWSLDASISGKRRSSL